MEDELPVREGGFPGWIGGGDGSPFPDGWISGSFPITGFAWTGNDGGGGGKRYFGAFLARQGDEEEKGRVGDVGGV